MRTTVTAIVVALLALASCTYGEQTRLFDLDNLVSGDESKAAILAEHAVLHRPTGLAAFPDGGSPKRTDHTLDVYVVDLASRKILYRHAIPLPREWSKSSLSAWLLGWKDDDVYVKLTGCISNFRTWYKGCGMQQRATHVYRVSRRGAEPAEPPSTRLVRQKNFGGPRPDAPSGMRSYLTSNDDGVWIKHGMRGKREPLLRVVGGRELEQIVD